MITVCDNAREMCPLFPGNAKILHKSFDDPPYLARSAEKESEKLVYYRCVSDEIRAFVEELPERIRMVTEQLFNTDRPFWTP